MGPSGEGFGRNSPLLCKREDQRETDAHGPSVDVCGRILAEGELNQGGASLPEFRDSSLDSAPHLRIVDLGFLKTDELIPVGVDGVELRTGPQKLDSRDVSIRVAVHLPKPD